MGGGHGPLRAGYEGYLPRFDNPSGAANLSDLPWSFYNVMKGKYGLPHEAFFCAAVDEELTESRWSIWGSEVCIGYALWTEHACTGKLVPPRHGDGQGMTIVGGEPIHGPKKLGDALAATNPVVADPLYLYPGPVGGNAAGFDFARAKLSDFWWDYGGHFYRGRFESINVGFLDGHVERRGPADVKCRYLSLNSWNCR